MKNLFRLYQFTIFLSLFTFSTNVFADVKVKTRQTMSGQTYENTTYIKGKRQRSETMNGMMVNLTQCDLQRDVQLSPPAKTYIISPYQQEMTTTTTTGNVKQEKVTKGGVITSTVTTKDTGERKQMFGYTARHLIITMETVSSPDACSKTNSKMQFDGWYIDAEFALDCDQNIRYQNYQKEVKPGGCQDKYDMKQIGTAKRGYPVYEKMTMIDESGKEVFSTVNEVLEFSKATLDNALFEIPADYREVKNASEMYSVASLGNFENTNSNGTQNNSATNQTLKTASNNSASSANISTEVGAKKEGVVRIGMVGVKTTAVGEGLNAVELSTGIQNSLADYLKSPKIELVALEAKLPSSIDAEAKEKQCDFIIYATVAHKKGGGGFGVFSKVIAPTVGQVGIGHTGSTAGNIAGQVATQAIVNAGSVSASVKSKDEITLDIKFISTSGANAFSKQYKAKAKSDGEDIITPLIEQAAQAIVDATKK